MYKINLDIRISYFVQKRAHSGRKKTKENIYVYLLKKHFYMPRFQGTVKNYKVSRLGIAFLPDFAVTGNTNFFSLSVLPVINFEYGICFHSYWGRGF